MSLVEAFWGRMDRKSLFAYCAAQFLGAVFGVWIAHVMFHQAVIQISTKDRFAPHLWFSEVVATFGLISTIALAGRKHVEFAPMSIAAYITAAYWFTSSTSFANPAVTVARMLTNTFCGIHPAGVAPFILAQMMGASLAFVLIRKMSIR